MCENFLTQARETLWRYEALFSDCRERGSHFHYWLEARNEKVAELACFDGID